MIVVLVLELLMVRQCCFIPALKPPGSSTLNQHVMHSVQVLLSI